MTSLDHNLRFQVAHGVSPSCPHRTTLMSIPTIPVEQSWLLQPTHIACQRLLPVTGISCRNPGPESGAPALHTARPNLFSWPLSPASPPPYRPDSRRPQ